LEILVEKITMNYLKKEIIDAKEILFIN